MEGTTVGSYRILRQIGEGGMGRVYLGEHVTLGKRVAVKVLLAAYSTDADSVKRFFNEARASSRLNHASVVDIYDFGTLPSGSAFIVMEYCEGEPLSALIERKGRILPDLALDFARQIANALAVAHENGIVHRDLKPDNIFLVADSETRHALRVKVLDFGVAKLAELDGKGGPATRSGVILGTPAYMSPEQCRGGSEVDHRADIYSLGCVIFEMVTGGPPFVGTAAGDIIGAQLFAEPRSLVGIIPPPYDALVQRMLAKAPDDRVQTMRDVATKLGGSPQRLVSKASRPALVSSTISVGNANGQVVARAAKEKGSDHTLTTVAVAFCVAVLGSVLVVVLNKPAPYAKPLVAVAVASPAPAVPAPLPKIRVLLTSHPSGADVYRVSDGVFMGKTPWTTTCDAASSAVLFSLRANGYRPVEVAVKLEHDVETDTVLAKEKPLPKASRAKPTQQEDGLVNPFD